ncbi:MULTISPECIES: hypothetical protein [Flavobacteriaceae]|uniref:hypothetical protein n=1 Tax=Flavobacteriaceae TaxID=49546 RepID=UPI000C1564E7|nr:MULTISPECIES: hypothetical protein [Flavobacteriaceae]MDH7914623.1 hypothetical protein [Winogradskyella sp. SYSU M77433]PIB39158.1 hypothetical protein BFP75_12910 [Maribacter sp. 4G9]
MDRFNHYRNSYENELKKKDDLDKSINIPILIVTLIFGAVSYFAKSLNYECLNTIDYVILGFIGLTFIILCLGIFRIIISYNNGIKGYEYEITGSAKDYEKYRKELSEFYNEKEKKVESEFEESLITNFIECIDSNTDLNIFRTFQLFLAKRSIIISLILTFITFIVFLLKQII